MRKALAILGILDDSDIEWLIAVGKHKRIERGTALIVEGREIDDVCIVLDGAFAVRAAALGNKEIAQLRAGEIVGEMSFVDSRPPSASVIALEDSVVLAIPSAELTKRLNDPAFAARFYRSLAIFLANRLRNTVTRLGYGSSSADAQNLGDEIGPTMLETVAMAGVRFDWMMKRLRGEQ